MSVPTTSEGVPALQPMADGLMTRYECHKLPPLNVIYTDCDCCNAVKHLTWLSRIIS